MPTDDERREVARRLRSLRMTAPGVTSLGHGYLWSLLWAVSGEELGESSRSDWFERMCSRLAGLIEPTPTSSDTAPTCDRDTPQKAAEEMFGKMRHSMKEEQDEYASMLENMSVELHPVDRDALLALASDIDKQTDGSMFDAWLEDGHYIARRIREAVGA